MGSKRYSSEGLALTGRYERLESDFELRRCTSLTSALGHRQFLVIPMAPKPTPSTMVATCTLNLVLSTVGVGTLTMPWTTAMLGWVQLSLLFIAIFFVSVYNLYLLDGTCRALPRGAQWTSYGGVVAAALGRRGAYALEMFILLYSFGLPVSYLGVIGKQMLTIVKHFIEVDPFGQSWLMQPGAMMLLAVVFMVLPLSLLPDTSMHWAGAVGTACMIFTTAVVIGSAPWRGPPVFITPCGSAPEVQPGVPALEPVDWVSSLAGLLRSVPMLTFCLNAATAFVSVRSQLQSDARVQPSRKLVVRLIWAGQVIAFVNYALCGTAGYLTFCGDVPDNVLDAYPASHLTALAARLALTVQLSMAVAGIYVPLARLSLCHLVLGLEVDTPPTGAARCGSTVLLLGGAATVAWALGGMLALPLGLTSAVCTTAIMFIFPGLCYASCQDSSKGLGKMVAPLLFAMVGLIVGASSTITILTGKTD